MLFCILGGGRLKNKNLIYVPHFSEETHNKHTSLLGGWFFKKIYAPVLRRLESVTWQENWETNPLQLLPSQR